MDVLPTKDLLVYVNNFGAVALIALMVYKSPAILSGIGAIVEKNIGYIREVQKEALEAFKGEIDKILLMTNARFENVEKQMITQGETLKLICERLGKVEYANQSNVD